MIILQLPPVKRTKIKGCMSVWGRVYVEKTRRRRNKLRTQLAVGMNGMQSLGAQPYVGFFLRRTPQLAARFFTNSDLVG